MLLSTSGSAFPVKDNGAWVYKCTSEDTFINYLLNIGQWTVKHLPHCNNDFLLAIKQNYKHRLTYSEVDSHKPVNPVTDVAACDWRLTALLRLRSLHDAVATVGPLVNLPMSVKKGGVLPKETINRSCDSYIVSSWRQKGLVVWKLLGTNSAWKGFSHLDYR